MATLADLERKLAALDGDVYRVFTSSASPATEADLAAIEAQAGVPLSPLHRALLARWGVLVVEVVESVWPRPKLHDVLPAWQFSYGFHVPGVGAKVPQELGFAAAMTPELRALGVVPIAKRRHAPFVGIATTKGEVGMWAPEQRPLDMEKGDLVDFLLREIASLEEGVAKLRATKAGVEELMKAGRASDWTGPRASDVVDALKERDPADLAPHLAELADALLPPGELSMGCLDIIASAGAPSFASVAERVYAHFGEGDDPYVIELLGKVRDTSERAMEVYRQGLESDDDDVLDYTLGAIKALADQPVVQKLVPVIEAQLDASADGERRAKLVPVLGHLGAPRFPARLASLIDALDDNTYMTLCGDLESLAVTDPSLAQAMLARYRRLTPGKPAAFNVCLSLLEMGIEDRAHMEPLVKSYAAKGGAWAERAEPVLARWQAR